MVALYKDPNGEKIFTQTPADLNNTVGKSQPPPPSAVEDKNTIYAQELKIKGLEYQLEELTVSSRTQVSVCIKPQHKVAIAAGGSTRQF